MSYKAKLSLFLLILTASTYAQQLIQLKLVDQFNQQPISGASYQYGNQLGITNTKGEFQITFHTDGILLLSHTAYESVEITADSLLQLKTTQYIKLKRKHIQLFPVSIIALHTNKNEHLALTEQDHLHHDGGAVLSQQTGISGIQKSGSYGFDPVIRGFKYKQLNIVMNGLQSAIAACPNRMDPPSSQMAPNMSERIEIYKGPYALRYGAGLGATINFVDAPASFNKESKTYGRISGAWENNGEIKRTEALLGFNGKIYDWGIYGAWSDGNDYKDGSKHKVNSQFQRSSLGTHLHLQLSKSHQLGFNALHNSANDTDFPALPMDLKDDNTWMTKASHLYKAKNGSLKRIETSFAATWVDHKMDNLSRQLNPRKVNAVTIANTSAFAFRSEGILKMKQNRMYLGLDYKREAADGTRTREFLMGPMTGQTKRDNVWQDSHISKTGLFGEYHINRLDWNMILSTRLDFNRAEAYEISSTLESFFSSNDQNQLNPSVSFGINRILNQRVILGLWLGRAQRSGSLTERYINSFPVGKDSYEMIGNPELHPEINNQADFRFQVKNKNYRLNINLFAAYLTNYISSEMSNVLMPNMPSSPGVRVFTNLPKALQSGFEITWQQRISTYLKHDCSLAFTYGKDLDTNKPLPEIAPLDIRYKIEGTFLKNKLKPTIQLRQVLEQNRISSAFGERKTDAFFLAHFYIAFQPVSQIQLRGGINNLFDHTYHEHLNRLVKSSNNPINAPGRNIHLSVNYKF